MRVVLVVVSLVGCAPGGTAVAPKANAVPPVEAVGSAASAQAQSRGVVRIEPYTSTAPAIAIAKPREDESLAADAARSQPVVVEDGGYLEENPGARIALVLDGDTVRDFSDVRAPLALGAIDVTGLDPSPGEHRLVAVAIGPRGEAVRFGPDRRIASAVRRFFIGAPPPPSSAGGPQLLFLAPRGTYNGAVRAKSAVLDFVILGGDLGRDGLSLRVRIGGPSGTSDTALNGPGPYVLRGLENGDHRIDLELWRSGGPLPGRWAHASRTITVNLDGPAR